MSAVTTCIYFATVIFLGLLGLGFTIRIISDLFKGKPYARSVPRALVSASWFIGLLGAGPDVQWGKSSMDGMLVCTLVVLSTSVVLYFTRDKTESMAKRMRSADRSARKEEIYHLQHVVEELRLNNNDSPHRRSVLDTLESYLQTRREDLEKMS